MRVLQRQIDITKQSGAKYTIGNNVPSFASNIASFKSGSGGGNGKIVYVEGVFGAWIKPWDNALRDNFTYITYNPINVQMLDRLSFDNVIPVAVDDWLISDTYIQPAQYQHFDMSLIDRLSFDNIDPIDFNWTMHDNQSVILNP
ncbi:hypothetical protein FACS1894208_05010 [Clostridia bacterium]|nr:hypothetical protein FACS1894208_05010 [Clostridia bacterium]